MNLLSTLKVSTCILLLIALVWGVCAINAIRNMSQNFDVAVNEAARSLRLAGNIGAANADMYIAMTGSILATFTGEAARADTLRRDFAAKSATMAKWLSESRTLTSGTENEKMLAAIQSDIDRWQQEYQQVVRLCKAGDPAGADRHSLISIAPLYKELGDLTTQLMESNRRTLADHSQAVANRQILWIGTVMLLVFGFSLAIFAYVSSRLPEVSLVDSEDNEPTASWQSREI